MSGCGCSGDDFRDRSENTCANVPGSESLSSELSNLILNLFGQIVSSVDPNTGKYVWTLPCPLTGYSIPGFPPLDGEGYFCYILRAMNSGALTGPAGATGAQGPAGPQGTPGPPGSGNKPTFPYRIASSDVTLNENDGLLICTPGAPMNVDLPEQATLAGLGFDGKFYVIWTDGAFNVTIVPGGADSLAPNLPVLSGVGEAYLLVSGNDGVWRIV